ncbi:unknown [Eggerthella sp. CAG:209]|nr:unknown [Eggerthella sp. CAG:209]
MDTENAIPFRNRGSGTLKVCLRRIGATVLKRNLAACGIFTHPGAPPWQVTIVASALGQPKGAR